jgi:hypothetical protein
MQRQPDSLDTQGEVITTTTPRNDSSKTNADLLRKQKFFFFFNFRMKKEILLFHVRRILLLKESKFKDDSNTHTRTRQGHCTKYHKGREQTLGGASSSKKKSF